MFLFVFAIVYFIIGLVMNLESKNLGVYARILLFFLGPMIFMCFIIVSLVMIPVGILLTAVEEFCKLFRKE